MRARRYLLQKTGYVLTLTYQNSSEHKIDWLYITSLGTVTVAAVCNIHKFYEAAYFCFSVYNVCFTYFICCKFYQVYVKGKRSLLIFILRRLCGLSLIRNYAFNKYMEDILNEGC